MLKNTLFLSFAMVASAFGIGCEIAEPFAGPGYDNGITTKAEGPYFLAATHIILPEGDAEVKQIFDERMTDIQEVINEQPGLIGLSFRVEIMGNDYWTVTVWESEEDAIAWVSSDVHVKAMTEMADLYVGITTHWTVTEAELPPQWEDVKARLNTSSAY